MKEIAQSEGRIEGTYDNYMLPTHFSKNLKPLQNKVYILFIQQAEKKWVERKMRHTD